MKLLINEQEIKTTQDLENAMDWDVQQGEYASIKYILENREGWEKYENIEASVYYVQGHPAGYEYTFRNWYNDDKECLTPYFNGYAFNKKLSKESNVEKLIELLRNDGIELA